MPGPCLSSCPVRSPAGDPHPTISLEVGEVKETTSKYAINQKMHHCVLLPSIFVGWTSINLECQIRAGARVSLGNNASPKEKVSNWMIFVQNTPLALAAKSSQIITAGLTPFRPLPLQISCNPTFPCFFCISDSSLYDFNIALSLHII